MPLERLLLLFFAAILAAAGVRAAEDEFLDPEQAFRISARALDARSVEVRFDIAQGYYMYREQFRFAVSGGEATLGEPRLPAGKVKFDETFGKDVETYRGALAIPLPVAQASGPFRLTVTSQGCADRGLCYPPMASSIEVRLAALRRRRQRARRLDRRPAAAGGRQRGSRHSREAGRRDQHRVADRLRAHRRRAALRRLLDRRRRVLRRRRTAVVYAVRVADAADPVVDHRRRRRRDHGPRAAGSRSP